MRRLLSLLILALFTVPAPAVAPPVTDTDPLQPSARYNPAIPTLQSVLGYNAGEAFTSYHDLERFYQALAAASDRMVLEPYGETFEGRALYLMIVSSPQNLARREKIRAALARLSDSRKTTPEEAEQIASTTPTVVYLSYNVHGNESVSAEAAIQVLYELAASQDPRVLNWLENAVIVIDPIVNPDGRERYVNFFRVAVGRRPNPDRFAAEHQEPWPGGRTNHYYFDMNRDWTWQTQTETRARLAAYRKWHAQVHVDYHEMGASSTYYFAPPTDPVITTIKPLLKKWFEAYGRGNAAAFDRYGFRYFTKEAFDMFYPGYGDSWPSLNGAIGMTYEMAGGGFGGLAVNLAENERTLTLRDRIERHFVSSLATINTSVENREARLRDYYQFRRAAVQAGREGSIQQVYLVPGADRERAARAVRMLLRQGIEVHRADAPFDAENLKSSWGETIESKQLPAGTYVVDLAQPTGFLARTLLEQESEMDGIFFYDVTAWSLPLAMGVESYTTSKRSRATFTPVTQPPAVEGGLEEVANPTAYVFAWNSLNSARLLGKLLQENYKAYVSVKAFQIGGRDFSAGSVIVHREGNPDSLHLRIRELAQQTRTRVFAVPTQLADKGVDLGSRYVRFLRKPRIAILMDTPVSSNEYGFLWHLFEQRLGLPFTAIRTQNLGGVDLENYNVLILPSGFGSGYERFINKGLQKRLGDWVRKGGTLIGLKAGALFASKPRSGLTSVTYRFVRSAQEKTRLAEERAQAKKGEKPSDPKDKKENEQEELDRKLRKYGDRERARNQETIAGAILRAVVDNTHPLGFGFDEQIAVLNRTSPVLELTSEGENVIYYPEDGIKLGGFITEETQEKLQHTAYLIRERKGRGAVVLFAESPVFRGFWDGTNRLLLNAVFFGHVN